jgi:hypothetical protein
VEQPLQRIKGGVAVILSEELARKWREGKCKIFRGGEIIGTICFMCFFYQA